MAYNKALLLELLNKVGTARSIILDLYQNSLYEDGWSDQDIKTFEDNLAIYEDGIAKIEPLIPEIPWNDPANKKVFMEKYNDVLKADAKTFRLVKVRHDAYLTYRKFRKNIITNLNEAVGFVRNKGSLQLMEIFEYFNDECAKIPLYDNKNAAGQVTVRETPVLWNWYADNIPARVKEINKSTHASQIYDADDITAVFKGYYKARLAAFSIFNMITSSDSINGYDRYHNILDKYITASLKTNKEYKQLYDATDIENDFLPADDYQQIMDDRTWNAKGIYENLDFNNINESWVDDSIEAYNQKVRERRSKSQIKKINMLSKDSNVCRIATDGKHVYSTVTFYPGDIVEICPTRNIDKSSLYSRDMRDVVFEVVPNQEWVLPFGYCQYYDLPANEPANCSFIWDPIKRVIVITAINKIPKYSKLVLDNIENDFKK